VVLFVPAAGHRVSPAIPRGAAIVGRPRLGRDPLEVYYEGGAGRPGLRTLADRAVSATGRMLEGAKAGCRALVPVDALVAVGVVTFTEGRITLTGPLSERALADWLDGGALDRAELREAGAPDTGPEALSAERLLAETCVLDGALIYELLARGGVRCDGEAWVAPDGRRTVLVGEALMWALERIARER
jgi:hypothetical protein